MKKKHSPHEKGHPPEETKEKNIETLVQAVRELKYEGIKIMQKTVSFRTGLSLATIGRHWKVVENKLDFPISTKEVILEAALAMEAEGTPVTKEAVSIRALVSLSSVKKYWKEVDKELGLHRKTC